MLSKGGLIISTISALILLQGCVVPIPFKTMHSAQYCGKVLDTTTKEPVPNARVELSNHEKMSARAKTNDQGEYVVGPLYCWSWIGKGWPYNEGRFCRHEDDVYFNHELWVKLVISRKDFVTRDIPLPFDLWSDFDPEEISSRALDEVLLEQKLE